MIVLNLDVKPLSVNRCWQGRRYKTKAYKQYESALMHLLPNIEINFKHHLSINIDFGFSNSTSDIDNPLKPILDILQKKYGFSQNRAASYDSPVIYVSCQVRLCPLRTP